MGAGLVQVYIFVQKLALDVFLQSPVMCTRLRIANFPHRKNHRDLKNYFDYFFVQDILQSVETHETQIEETIVRGKELSQKEGALDLVPSKVSTLETLSSEVLNDCKVRREEIETALNNWTQYNEALEGFKDALADGEVEVTRRKALNVTGLEVVDQEKQEIKVLWQS